MEKGLTIAIDGPAGSGKSTTAKLVARRLGYTFIDTGAMYRAVTLRVLSSGIDPNNEKAVAQLAKDAQIILRQNGANLHISLDGKDVTKAIRDQEVSNNVSIIARNPEVRKVLVEKQRFFARKGGVVAEGRDIGTVVFPDADLKIFITASVEERVRRRKKQLERSGIHVSLAQLTREIEKRDRLDSTRKVSPLREAKDAVRLDTTNLSIDQRVDFIVNKALEIISVSSLSNVKKI